MAAGDAGAFELDRLIEENLPGVENMVLRISAGFPRFVDRAELVAAGTLGLVEAGRRYDPSTGIPFHGSPRGGFEERSSMPYAKPTGRRVPSVR